MVDKSPQQEEIKAVEYPHHGHHNGADVAVCAELIRQRNVEREYEGERRPYHGAEDGPRQLPPVFESPRRHPLVQQAEHQRQQREYHEEPQVLRQRKQKVQRVVRRHGVFNEVEYLASVDHDEKAQKKYDDIIQNCKSDSGDDASGEAAAARRDDGNVGRGRVLGRRGDVEEVIITNY